MPDVIAKKAHKIKYPIDSFHILFVFAAWKTKFLLMVKLKIPEITLAIIVALNTESRKDRKKAKKAISSPKLRSDEKLNLIKTRNILAESIKGLKCELELLSM